jgi:hypothetical protein
VTLNKELRFFSSLSSLFLSKTLILDSGFCHHPLLLFRTTLCLELKFFQHSPLLFRNTILDTQIKIRFFFSSSTPFLNEILNLNSGFYLHPPLLFGSTTCLELRFFSSSSAPFWKHFGWTRFNSSSSIQTTQIERKKTKFSPHPSLLFGTAIRL